MSDIDMTEAIGAIPMIRSLIGCEWSRGAANWSKEVVR